MSKQFPQGDTFTDASNRGESILAYYQKQAGGSATAADLIADVLAIVEAERSVAYGETRAEGAYTANIESPESVIEEAQASLETWIAEFKADQDRENHRHVEG